MTMGRDAVELRERVAVAAGTSDLTPEGLAAQVIGAMGSSAMVRYFDTTLGRRVVRQTKAGTPINSERGRLGALLERAKYSGDRKAERPAVLLFAHLLGARRGWCDRLRIKRGSPLLIALAGIVVTEWIYDRCAQCGGGGRVAVGNVHARNVKTDRCGVCGGAGRPQVDHSARAQALGLTMTAYQAHWKSRIDDIRGCLLDIEADGIERLRSQMRRGTLHSVSDKAPR